MPASELEVILEDFDLSKDELTRECNLTLYQSGKKKVLFDAGAGVDFLSGMGTLVESLEAIDLSTDDITDVVFTHAHPDHIWGVLDDFDDLTFQNANYHIGRMEWDYWFDTETVNKVREDRIPMAVGAKRRLEALEGNINLFDSNDEIIDGIKALLTPGHSPGHMSFEVGKSSQKALVIGDALNNHHVAFRRPEWVSAGLDQDPNLAADTRKKLLEKIVSEQLKVVGFHLPNGGIGHVEKIAAGYNFVNS
jgi:glyoxylase-like metal-dependent hydrolase (beta-lactamase superfamily II)